MKTKSRAACVVLLMFAVSCARPGSAPIQPVDNISALANRVAVARARLDSVVAEIHRLSGDTTTSAGARSRQLRAEARTLDSAYRADLVELLATITASTAGVPASTARFPLETSTGPFVRAFADGANWLLQSPLLYQIGKNDTDIVIVPRGFITDFASMPQPFKALRDLVPSTDRYGIPALVHDYLYWRQDCTREQADNIMEISLKQAGISLLERRIVREGLRQFGQASWDANKRARASGLIRTVGAPYDQVPLAGTWTEYREWLRTARAKEGVEYPTPRLVCSAGERED